ncbi:Membrane biogenesis protein (Yop1) [Rasamsonia emersonii CBS 393.64]|uniref:Membrane biogenesis protein (Yop1) n=1 Tax=Rasamsonia emersonii (strain ATCC 16479 / CBS 393.64 / IMI 116815) TaxID=1408163 RepID=A0A0F4YVM6_RASE3|nr:Membrane biogenesis protein (Yop1) [Rasamsonia emersonii CBS 393.64]KKA21911.1 Membrane biogenesis protein (Yop1) [Rasamsonia emersonii CBS 393.64]
MATFQDRAQHYIAQIDKELSKYPILNNLERQTSVPKVYAFLGVVGIYFFLVFFNILGQFLVNLAGFAIPGYYSLHALFTAGTADDTQWLTYWVVYAFLAVVESAINAPYWFLHPGSLDGSSSIQRRSARLPLLPPAPVLPLLHGRIDLGQPQGPGRRCHEAPLDLRALPGGMKTNIENLRISTCTRPGFFCRGTSLDSPC